MAEIVLGIDTSNYTTSIAALDEGGNLFEHRCVLDVPEGQKGLRQRDALFAHTVNLPLLFRRLYEELPDAKVTAIGASARPRDAEGSYMPAFLAGMSAASALGITAGPPKFFSHQAGHIAAAIYGLRTEGVVFPDEEPFYALHLSGGTTELLSVEKTKKTYEAKLVGGAGDVTLGQLVDRCGVALGLKFPCGAALEELAMKSGKSYKTKITIRDGFCSISGIENKFLDMIKRGEAKEDVAKFTFDSITCAIDALLAEVRGNVLFSGGVSSSTLLRSHFSDERFYFAHRKFCSDNAIGIASLVRRGFTG